MNNLKTLTEKHGLTNGELVLLIEPRRKDAPTQLISNRAQALFKMDLRQKSIVFLGIIKAALNLKSFTELYEPLPEWTNNLKKYREVFLFSQHEVGKTVLKHIYEGEESVNTSVTYSGHVERLEKMDPKLMDPIIRKNFCKMYSIKPAQLWE